MEFSLDSFVVSSNLNNRFAFARLQFVSVPSTVRHLNAFEGTTFENWFWHVGSYSDSGHLGGCGGKTSLQVGMTDLVHGNLAVLQILGMLQLVVAGSVLIVRRTVVLFGASVRLTLLLRPALVYLAEVHAGHHTVCGPGVISRCRLEVVEMGEASCGALSGEEGHPGVAVPERVGLFAVEETQHVVLHDGVLADTGGHSARGFAGDAVANGEDVLELLVLERVLVHVHEAIVVSHPSVNQELVRL